MNNKTDRRTFLEKTSIILGAVLVAPAVIGTAAAAQTMFGRGGADGYLMDTILTATCVVSVGRPADVRECDFRE
jgi:hypothetical protein